MIDLLLDASAEQILREIIENSLLASRNLMRTTVLRLVDIIAESSKHLLCFMKNHPESFFQRGQLFMFTDGTIKAEIFNVFLDETQTSKVFQSFRMFPRQ